MLNAFQVVVSLSSGVEIPSDIQDDLLDAQPRGEVAHQAFNERLSSGQGFYNHIKLLKLKTYKKKTVKVTLKDKDCVLQAELSLFSRFLFLPHWEDYICKMSCVTHLAKSLWNIANSDGSPKQTNKSFFWKISWSICSLISSESRNCGHSGLHANPTQLETDHFTFDSASHTVLQRALAQVPSWKIIHIVADDYHKISIKNTERDARATGGKIDYSKIIGGHKIREWKKILRSTESKLMMIEFFAKDWANNPARLRLLRDRMMYVTSGNSCSALGRFTMLVSYSYCLFLLLFFSVINNLYSTTFNQQFSTLPCTFYLWQSLSLHYWSFSIMSPKMESQSGEYLCVA